MTLGTQLEQLYAAGRRDIVLVAPFVKIHTLRRLLNCIGEGVPVRCITRWRPEEIVAGVSDLEVWQLLRDRPRSSLWLRPDLHAKYYRADERCQIGSANLTDTALGWVSHPNLELLVELPVDYANVPEFEAELLRGSFQVDEVIYQQTLAVVELLKQQTDALPPIVHEHRDVPMVFGHLSQQYQMLSGFRRCATLPIYSSLTRSAWASLQQQRGLPPKLIFAHWPFPQGYPGRFSMLTSACCCFRSR